MMISQMGWRLTLCVLAALVVMSIIEASAAANDIAPSSLDDISRSIALDDLKPAACGTRHIDELIVGSGVISGSAGNDLILGSADDDVISGGGGDDCILGGGGDDTLIGGDGYDTCLGGSGSDILDPSCERKEP